MAPIKTYMLVPHHDFPADALPLGSIILNPKDPGRSVNVGEIVEVPHTYTTHKYNWEQTTDLIRDGQAGVWARCVNFLWGLGGNLGASFDAVAVDKYRFQDLETIFFSPTQDYVEEAVGKRRIRAFLEGARYAPVYMITGLKIVRGPGAQVISKRTLILESHAKPALPGLMGASPFILDAGDASLRHEGTTSSSFSGSSDFIIAYQLSKLTFEKNGNDSATPKHQPHLKNAMMGISDPQKPRGGPLKKAMKVLFEEDYGAEEYLGAQDQDTITAIDETDNEICQCIVVPA